jgi:hypothetical protein
MPVFKDSLPTGAEKNFNHIGRAEPVSRPDDAAHKFLAGNGHVNFRGRTCVAQITAVFIFARKSFAKIREQKLSPAGSSCGIGNHSLQKILVPAFVGRFLKKIADFMDVARRI